MDFELLTLSGVKHSGQVTEVLLRTADGDIAVMPHHEPLVALVLPGPVTVRSKDKEDLYATYGGLLDVANNRVRLLSDEADHADDLVESEIEEALERAEAAKAGITEKHELHRAQQLIDRQAVRLEVARIRRRRRNR